MDKTLQKALNDLASAEVGLGSSTLVFVSSLGDVRAVFTQRTDLQRAIQFAKGLGEFDPVIVEDFSGIAWENRKSEKQQMESDDD